jgi:pimeloyl-ACP methyl ester carboxylesterase
LRSNHSSAWTYILFLQDYGGPVGFRLAIAHPKRLRALIGQNAVAIVFLESSPFITGEILHVDGGQIAGH